MKSFLHKLKFLIQLIDGIWSVPLAFISFWLVGIILQSVFGLQTGSYDMSFIQPLFLSATIVIGANSIAVLGIYFTFRGLFRYLYGTENKDTCKIDNPSKKDWQGLTVWQRFIISFLVFFYYVTLVVIVYLKLV